MQTSDMGNVEVQLGRDTELQDAQFVEVIGKVADSGEVLREFTSVDLGPGVGELESKDCLGRTATLRMRTKGKLTASFRAVCMPTLFLADADAQT